LCRPTTPRPAFRCENLGVPPPRQRLPRHARVAAQLEGSFEAFLLLGQRLPIMGWSGRAPAPAASDACAGHQSLGVRHGSRSPQECNRRRRHRHRQELVPRRRFLDERGAIVLRQKWSRGQVETRFANMPPCLIRMEACVGAHHLSRGLQKLGQAARLMPARYVRPYSHYRLTR
jgi:hypothetical protein